MRIGLDIDGILYRWSDMARFLFELKFGIVVDPSDEEYHNWNYVEDHATQKQRDWLWGPGVTEYGLFRHGSLWRGSVEAVRALKDMGELVFITSRPEAATQDTLDWLHLHFRDWFDESNVHILHDKPVIKSSVKPECDIYLDDKPSNAVDYAKNTNGLSVLWTRSYNERDQLNLPVGVLVVDSWEQFIHLAQRVKD